MPLVCPYRTSSAYGCSLCKFGDRPLHDACARGLVEIVAVLVEKGAEMNAPNLVVVLQY